MSRHLAERPCGSCPYRCDVPSGVWSAEEYDKLPGFDLPIHRQPPVVFFCHRKNGKLCAGWVGCHDMDESLGLRLWASISGITQEEYEEVLDYECPTPLWSSGAEAAEHGKRDIVQPSAKARTVITKLSERERASRNKSRR